LSVPLFTLSALAAARDGVRADAPLADGDSWGAGAIPQHSIRLRILADSDAPADQALKHRVRDAVAARIGEWAARPRSLEEARAYIRAALPELEQLARSVAEEEGFAYDIKAEFGVVPFPTKVYGGRLYPAGEYEAVLITIGRGLGSNWWCVLFPPPCFVDTAAAEAPRASGVAAAAAEPASENEPKVEYRFFLLDVLASVIAAIRGWFA